MTRPSHHPGVTRTPSGSFEGWVLYAPRAAWLVRLAEGWRLPWIVTTDRSGWSVILEKEDE